ncbi:protein transport protein Sec31A-like isoform X1 [Stegodyphus dumicola]|uniref:protein transport protein Sec31A-like isoform X1 n=2 Tax=Stegodyphus dumicola TaxID=202533 RepID=UPI0015AE3FBF|nr:protein transport protein Sec31A-like isoform X1 [Stegodyphus dumicola]
MFNLSCDLISIWNCVCNRVFLFFQGEVDGLISQALLTGNIASAVEICIEDNRWADALVLAQAGGPDILQKTQRLYFKSVSTNSSKLISAVVTSDWLSMVKNCNIKCWKEILAAILTYAKPADFAYLCEHLGRRLENEPKLKENAALCYISAGNLERLAESWVKIHENMDVTTLQSLIEQVMILRRAVEQLSGTAPALETGVLSSLLGQYAEMLATQGSLNSAATYLVDPNERTLAILRDRIYQALGYRSPHFPFQRVDVRRSSSVSVTQPQYGQQQQQQPNLSQPRRQSFQAPAAQPQFSYGSVAPSMPGNFAYSTSNTSAQYQQPLPPMVTPPPSATIPPPMSPAMPAAAAAPSEPPTQMPAKSTAGTHHLSQRYPRHLHDPSVYSENTYSNQQYYQPQAFSVAQPQMNPYPPQPAVSSYYSPPDSNVGGNVAYPPASASTGAPFYQQTAFNAYPPGAQMQPQAAPLPPPAQPSSISQAPLPSCYNEVKPGWNDPPLLKQAPVKQRSTSFETPTPITSPFPDVPVPEPQMLPQNQNAPPGGYFTPQYPSQPPASLMNPTPPVPNPVPEELAKPNPPIIPEPPKEKGPIPPEHQVLQDIFEDLRRQCQQIATNPQTRRKLDDVAKKLENLYDRLRENTLTNQVTHGLHQIVQAIMQSDYSTALAIHGQIVGSANFSEISGFMPSIKVLLQVASQLNVFLQ